MKRGSGLKKEVFQKIYEQSHTALYLYAFSLTHDRDDAEDLVSETFVKAFLSYSGEGNFQAWLFRTLKNTFIDECRKKKRFVHVDESFMDVLSTEKDALNQTEERKQWLYRQIYLLSETERNVILLTIHSGLRDAEIAELMHISIQNLRVIRHRTVSRLKQLAKKEGMYE
ncbi:MAG: RNA polymerase sigma factor [Solobacterium sp.]|nr:RNA polymerase sigma factor [Solobacterium sp.]